MSALDQLALVVRLACLTEDRDNTEQKALLAVAERVDKEWNAQTITNAKVRAECERLGWPTMIAKNARGEVVGGVPCTYSDDHPKSCPCRGDGMAVEPAGGWSRLVALVESTREPEWEPEPPPSLFGPECVSDLATESA